MVELQAATPEQEPEEVEVVVEEDAEDTSVTAESTLAVRDNAGYGRPAVLCKFRTRLDDRVGIAVV